VQLLTPHRDFFTGRGLQLPALNDGLVDCEKLASIFMTPDTDMPNVLANALFLIHEMSTKDAMDKLVVAAEAVQPPVNLDGADEPADVAVRVWLLRRSVLEAVHSEYELSRPKTFVSYLTDRDPVPEFKEPNEASRRAWEQNMDAVFQKKKRGDGCRVMIYLRDGYCWFLVRHGEPCRREGSYEQGKPGSVFYRPQQHDVLIYNLETGELSIHAGSQWERDLYRESLGVFVFSIKNFFPGDGKYTLEPLILKNEAALKCGDVDEIEWVKLREVEFELCGSGRKNPEREIRKANDLFTAFEARGFNFKPGHVIKRAVFAVKFKEAKRSRSVTITPSNRAKYDRDGDSTIMEAWLKLRGFILEQIDEDTDGPLADA
jgi:hypothetical protein